ncbi:PstS family phosphate ABC transporter substrate-binding protein [Candidatus Nitrospira neomarina]|uniref:Phosphate-binding protein n=1 Tax=Candidatus Nitrospira neomarina TaxID=3020899 RepID=A0AA96GJZ3_9BACT|nr:phosphate ABC transporter substrate-binding protein [Candidatus Nitrospira neomarina]WNM62708.1 phosphate ABC transporter substrate-binding protein [Candidatus Nitrospira neomarina]
MRLERIKFLEGAMLFGLLFVVLSTPALGADDLFPNVDQQIPRYSPQSRVSGKIEIDGSTTMKTILETWKDKLENIHPDLEISLKTDGSNTGLESLMSGKTKIAAMSRTITKEEIEKFTKQSGHAPTAIPVAVDAFAIFVHKDNPLDHITLQQLDALFSSDRRRGAPESIDTWGQLGLTGVWEKTSIVSHIRDAKSGTGQFFREFVLLNGQNKEMSIVQPGAASVVHAVMNDPYAVGYSGIGYRTNSVKPLHVAAGDGAPFVEPTFQSATNGSYPLHRRLYLYVNESPDMKHAPLLSEIITFAVSLEGQQVVAKSGFFPLPTKDLMALSATWSRPMASVSNTKGPKNFK